MPNQNSNSNNSWMNNNNNVGGVIERKGRFYMKIGNKEINVTNRFRPNRPQTHTPTRNPKPTITRSIPSRTSAEALLSTYFRTLRKNNYNVLKNKLYNFTKQQKKTPGLKLPKGYTAKNNSGELVGFAIVQNRPRNNVRNLHLIVSKRGVGRNIFNQIVNDAKRNNRSMIALNAIKSAVPSYLKWGFKNIGNAGNYQIMTYNLRK